MKTKITIVALLIAFLSFNAFGQAGKSAKMTPIDYNDQMADITDSLYQMGREWGVKFNEIVKGDRNFALLSTDRKRMTGFIARTTEKIKRQPPVGKGSEGLKSAMVSFLSFENKMIENAFLGIEKLTSTSTQSEMETAFKNLTDQADKEGEILKMVNAAQEAYGKQNGFTIESEQNGE